MPKKPKDEDKRAEGTLIFEQAYLQSRVIQLTNGDWDIEFAILDGKSIGITEPSEVVARSIYAGLDQAYREAVKDLQAKMLEALTSVTDAAKAHVDDAGTPHILDN